MNVATSPTARELTAERMRPAGELLAAGRALAKVWRAGTSLFQKESGFPSEAAYKRAQAATGRIMQHAHIGFRGIEKTLSAIAEIHESCAAVGTTVDRFGITLDWSMGYPNELRSQRPRGTGIVLSGPEDFGRIANAAPTAAHFGDFMLGLPAALENTQAAIAAGVTSVGNLGQYFTFRLPYWDDDIATTEATLTALGLIAAQEVEILVHSNLDDGFAGLFADMSSSLGMVMVEKYLIEELVGAKISHCYGHHFSDPLSRQAFHCALNRVSGTPGTMIFGNTVSYQSSPAGNYASLASYLLADMLALRRVPSGHAVNPVPVTENERIPDVDEIIAAQTFATRLAAHAAAYEAVWDWQKVDLLADRLVEGGQKFAANLLAGMAGIGVDTSDAAALMLAIRRLGPKRLEAMFGAGEIDAGGWGGRSPLVPAAWMEELNHLADKWIGARPPGEIERIRKKRLRACVATTDVHEHGKFLIERVFKNFEIEIVDGGVAADPDDLAGTAMRSDADFIAVSTYNGVALQYAKDLVGAVKGLGKAMPILMGGKLNQIPEDSNSGLPVDVTADIRTIGVMPCAELDSMLPVLARIARKSSPDI